MVGLGLIVSEEDNNSSSYFVSKEVTDFIVVFDDFTKRLQWLETKWVSLLRQRVADNACGVINLYKSLCIPSSWIYFKEMKNQMHIIFLHKLPPRASPPLPPPEKMNQ